MIMCPFALPRMIVGKAGAFFTSAVPHCLQLKIILMPKWYIWGWHIPIPYIGICHFKKTGDFFFFK